VFAILNPIAHWRAGHEIVSILLARRQLTWELTKRELTEKYAGQVLGALWAFAHPLILMSVYVFLFAVVFKAKIDTTGRAVHLDFTVYILSGLIPWLMFQEAMSKGTTAIVGNASLVKQVVFPIEILPAKVVLATFMTQVIFVILLTGYVLLRFHALPWTFVFVPVLMLIQCIAMAGICYAVAAVGCYLRDLKDLVTVFAVVNLYLMPVVYLPEWVPDMLRPVIYLNPFSYMTWCYQDAVFFGAIEHPRAWVIFPVLSVIVFGVGYRMFRRLKVQFGNVL